MDPPCDDTGDGHQSSVWTISNHTFFCFLGVFVKLTLFCFPITQLSQRPMSIDITHSNAPFATRIIIPLVLMCPSLLCHRHEPEAPSATTSLLIHPTVVYKVQNLVPRANTIAPFTISYEPFPNSAAYPVLSN